MSSSEGDTGSITSDYRSVVSNESDFEDYTSDDLEALDADSVRSMRREGELVRRYSYQSQSESLFSKIPTTVVGGDGMEEKVVQDGVIYSEKGAADIFTHYKPTHFYGHATKSSRRGIMSGECAAGVSGAFNIFLGIVALLPWLADTLDGGEGNCDLDSMNRWLIVFGVVAIVCPALQSVSAKFNTHSPFVGDEYRRRGFVEWIVIFLGPSIMLLNWGFNLAWAVLSVRIFTKYRLLSDPGLTTQCQREHDIGWVIMVVILSSVSIFAIGTCIFSFRYIDVLVRNAYRRRRIAVDDG